MSTRDKLEYQKTLRFIRESATAKAQLGSPELKLSKIQQESDLTKPVTTLGDKDNKVPPVKEPKSANEVPKTRETSRVKDPIKDGDKGDNCLDVNLDDIDYAKIAEGRGYSDRYEDRFRDVRDRKHMERDERGGERGGDDFVRITDGDREGDEGEDCVRRERYDQACTCNPVDVGVCEPDCPSCGDDFISEATKRQKDAKQSLARHKVATKNKRTKSMKRKSNAQMKKENTMTLGDVFLNELSTFNKDELPGSGDISKQMKDFDDLLQKFTKEALELHKKFEEEMKVDMLGGQASPQMAPRIGERNRMLMVRAGVLRKLAAACTGALEAVRREG